MSNTLSDLGASAPPTSQAVQNGGAARDNVPAMSYRIYCFDGGLGLLEDGITEFATDAEALDCANALAAAHQKVELWHDDTLLVRLEQPSI